MILRKLVTIGIVTAIFTLIGSVAKAGGLGTGGLSKERQASLLESLRDYQPMPKAKRPQEFVRPINKECEGEYNYSTNQHCRELKYMKDGYYIVNLRFLKEKSTPTQPHAPAIAGSDPFKRDTANRNSFLKEWSDPLLRKYVGEDYQKFSSAKLTGVTRRAVLFELQIQNADELKEILQHPRIKSVLHIGNPELPLEEIAN